MPTKKVPNDTREAKDTAGRVHVYVGFSTTSGTAGRLLFFVPRDHMYLVRGKPFTFPQIAELISISRHA